VSENWKARVLLHIAGIQKQVIVTNKQAIICATHFGYVVRRCGVMTRYLIIQGIVLWC